MTDKKKTQKKTSVKRQDEEKTDILIHLSLRCPSCGWEWGDSLSEDMSSTPQCIRCFHSPVFLIEAVCF